MYSIQRIRLLSGILMGMVLMGCNDDYSNLSVPFPAPTELTGSKLAPDLVQLSWKDNSKGEEGFIIERQLIGSQEAPVSATVAANITQWEDRSAGPMTYRYSVSAFYGTRRSDAVTIAYQHIPVNEPGNFKLQLSDGKVELSWNGANDEIDGYTVERKVNNSSFSVLATVDKNTLTYTDKQPLPGTLTYRLYSTRGVFKSSVSDQLINYVALPAISIQSVTTSYVHLSPDFTLESDGGASCQTGICWSYSPAPTINDSSTAWHVAMKSGDKGFVSTRNLSAGVPVYIRAYATNAGGTAYSNEVTGIQLNQPPAIELQWEEMTAINAQLPAEIKAYKTNSQLNGRNFSAWYIIADLSTGAIELKTVFSSTARKPSAHIASLTSEKVYATINGGYFGYNGSTAVSYSMVIDRGQKLADNIGALTRGSYIYPVTRGVVGVTAQQVPVLKWAAGNFAYNTPSPNVEGEVPQPSLSSTFPEQSTGLNAYSAIGGAPVLLFNGKLAFDFTTTLRGKYRTNYELLQTDIFSSSARPPRTAIGSTADNKLLFFVCDGRQLHSDGATLVELALILKGLGCVNALNLDGGGSSAIVAGGSLLNKPSDGTERAVPSIVAFVQKK